MEVLVKKLGRIALSRGFVVWFRFLECDNLRGPEVGLEQRKHGYSSSAVLIVCVSFSLHFDSSNDSTIERNTSSSIFYLHRNPRLSVFFLFSGRNK